jgi:hypothetical protein
MKTQKILLIVTESPSLRSKAVGWNCEDGSMVVAGKPIGLSPSPSGREYVGYDCPLRAIADGWWLMCAPLEESKNMWNWWFEKIS